MARRGGSYYRRKYHKAAYKAMGLGFKRNASYYHPSVVRKHRYATNYM